MSICRRDRSTKAWRLVGSPLAGLRARNRAQAGCNADIELAAMGPMLVEVTQGAAPKVENLAVGQVAADTPYVCAAPRRQSTGVVAMTGPKAKSARSGAPLPIL